MEGGPQDWPLTDSLWTEMATAMPGGLSAGKWAELADGLGWEAQRLSKQSTNCKYACLFC